MPGLPRPFVLVALVAGAAFLARGPDAAAPQPVPGSRHQEKQAAREALRAGDYDAPTTGWREGPVRYLLSKDEDLAYRHLATSEERARFIERFWASRDPDLSTPDNEFRDLFYRRVVSASRLFTAESTKPGWKTDRGKIYILLGPPDDFDETIYQQDDTQLITWTYRDPPPGTGASPNTQVRFVRDPSGEFRMTTGIRLFSSETAMSLALATQALQVNSLPETRRIQDGAAAPAAPGGGAGAPDAAGTGAPRAAAGQTGSAGSGALRARADVFRTGDRLALVVLTVWLKEGLLPDAAEIASGGTPRVQVEARLADADRPSRAYTLAGASALRPAAGDLGRGPDDTRLYQGGVIVEPGTYVVDYSIALPDRPPERTLSDRLTVPAPVDTGLAVGRIALAAHVERLPGLATPEYSPPFMLGRLRIVPRADDLLAAGDDLAFYYQILGATTDPIEGRPDLDLEYRLLYAGSGAGGQAEFQPFGRPIHLTEEQGLLQAFSLATAGWSPGTYRLVAIVTDNLSGSVATGTTDFRIR